MTEWEVWLCAAKLREDHGELAGSIQAAMKADALLEAGDVAGYGQWIRVMAAIPLMGRLAESEGTDG